MILYMYLDCMTGIRTSTGIHISDDPCSKQCNGDLIQAGPFLKLGISLKHCTTLYKVCTTWYNIVHLGHGNGCGPLTQSWLHIQTEVDCKILQFTATKSCGIFGNRKDTHHHPNSCVEVLTCKLQPFWDKDHWFCNPLKYIASDGREGTTHLFFSIYF